MAYQLAMRCPHCNSLTNSEYGREISSISHEVRYACRDFDCGYTFVAMVTATRTLRPSAKPNSQITIPLSEKVRPETWDHAHAEALRLAGRAL